MENNSSTLDNSFVVSNNNINNVGSTGGIGTNNQQNRSHFKVAIIGAHNVGKTSFIIRYTESRFLESYYPTNKENHFTKSIKYDLKNGIISSLHNSRRKLDLDLHDGMENDHNKILHDSDTTGSLNRDNINLEFIDTMGQDCKKEANLNISYWKSFMNLDGCILCYNVNNLDSFTILENIWEKILTQFELPTKDFPLLLLGTKNDGDGDPVARQVSWDQGNQLAKTLNALFFECSAKDDHNINLSMGELIRMMELEQRKKFGNNNHSNGDNCIVM
ncbi:rheb-like protein Rhb1p [Monosporozyma servazzii]